MKTKTLIKGVLYAITGIPITVVFLYIGYLGAKRSKGKSGNLIGERLIGLKYNLIDDKNNPEIVLRSVQNIVH